LKVRDLFRWSAGLEARQPSRDVGQIGLELSAEHFVDPEGP